MIFLFDGEEEFGRAEAVKELIDRFGDETLASLNTTVLEASKLGPGALEEAALSAPFMAERRLVVVYGLLTSLGARRSGGRKPANGNPAPQDAAQSTWLQRASALISELPASTDMVFVEPSAVSASNPLFKALQSAGLQRRTFPALNLRRNEDRAALADWIRARTAKKGGRIDADGVTKLIDRCGPNHRLLDQELEKLVVYSGSAVITEGVVAALTTETRETDVWEMIRAIGRRDVRSALHTLHQLLDAGERPEALFFQLVRQLRLLIQVADLSHTTDSAGISERLGLQDWQVRQHRQQLESLGEAGARRFYRELLETDLAIKTGRTTTDLALDLLVGELCRAG